MDFLIFIIGLVLLLVAGEILVKGAVGIATMMRISPLVVGMTVVSFGTSAPELLVSLQSALSGNPDIAIGNVLGSNIANIALVLGVTALIFPIVVDKNSIRIDWPAMMIATLMLFGFMLNNKIERWEGITMFLALIGFTIFLIRKSRKDSDQPVEEEKSNTWLNVLFILGGCVGLVFGSDLFVDGACGIAKRFGVSDLVIGSTVVAFGTSVPELVTSGVAAFRKQTDISIGNLIGSNLFNIAAILGLTSIVKEINVNESALAFDMWWVVAIAALIFPMMVVGKRIGRVKGAFLALYYCAYIYFVAFTPEF